MSVKHRINLVFSMDNPMQKKAWDILTEYPSDSGTRSICQTLCRYCCQNALSQSESLTFQKLRSVFAIFMLK